MFAAKRKLFLQRLMLGVMILATVGIGTFRVIRLAGSGTRRHIVTYDTDLHDKSPAAKPVRIHDRTESIRDDLNRAGNLINGNDPRRPIALLQEAESEASAQAEGVGDASRGRYFREIGNRIAGIKTKLSEGDRDEAGRQLDELVKTLETGD